LNNKAFYEISCVNDLVEPINLNNIRIMTKEEHIQYWTKQVNDDFDCANVLYQANHFAQSLFWAHLALEKMSKALWIKTNDGNAPPLSIIYYD